MFKIGFRAFVTKKEMEIAKRIGIEVVEVRLEHDARKRADEIKGLLSEYCIKPSALGIYPQGDLEELKRDIDYMESIGCPVYIGHPGALKITDKEGIKAFKEFWTPACEYAADKGIRVAIHSCGLGPESWDIMLNEVPALKLKYDPSFSYQAGRNVPAEIIKYAEYICHMHVKDEMYVGRTTDYASGIMQFRYAPAGMGDINWGSIISLLYELGYKGDIAIEPHSDYYWDENNGLERGLILAKRHLEQFMA